MTQPNPTAEPVEREKFDLHITMKKGSWSGVTLVCGDKLVCAAHVMNLIEEGCTEVNIVRK